MDNKKEGLHVPPHHGFLHRNSNSVSAFSDVKLARHKLNKLLKEYNGRVSAEVLQSIRNIASQNPVDVSPQVVTEFYRSIKSYLELVIENSNYQQYEPPQIVFNNGEHKVVIARYDVEPPVVEYDDSGDLGPDNESGDYEDGTRFGYK